MRPIKSYSTLMLIAPEEALSGEAPLVFVTPILAFVLCCDEEAQAENIFPLRLSARMICNR